MKFYFLLFVAVFCLASRTTQAKGGYVIGNGGNALKCYKNGKFQYTSYDIKEAEMSPAMKTKYSLKKGYRKKVDDVLSRIQLLNPGRVILYREWLESFENESQFTPDGFDLIQVPDISVGVLPQGCELIQAIVQINNPLPGSKRYLINVNVWNHLDENQRSALVLHELIYREAILPENQHPNSYFVRLFNQMIFADGFAKMSLKTYIETLIQLKFSQADAHLIPIQLTQYNSITNKIVSLPVEFWNDHSVRAASVYWRSKTKYKNLSLEYNCNNFQKFLATIDTEVHFFQNHEVKSISLPAMDSSYNYSTCGGGKLDLGQNGTYGWFRANHFEFDLDGNIVQAQSRGMKGEVVRMYTDKGSLSVYIHMSSLSDGVVFNPYKGFYFSGNPCNPFYSGEYKISMGDMLLTNQISSIRWTESTTSPIFGYCQ